MGLAHPNVPSNEIEIKPDTKSAKCFSVLLIIQNERQEIFIIHAEKGKYYKLPGGGIEEDEGPFAAAERGLLKETGCKVDINYGGYYTSLEHRRKDIPQTTFLYTARLVDTGVPQLTKDELADDFMHQWVTLDNALEMMRKSQPVSDLGRYIKDRDTFLLQAFLADNPSAHEASKKKARRSCCWGIC